MQLISKIKVVVRKLFIYFNVLPNCVDLEKLEKVTLS